MHVAKQWSNITYLKGRAKGNALISSNVFNMRACVKSSEKAERCIIHVNVGHTAKFKTSCALQCRPVALLNMLTQKKKTTEREIIVGN